MPDNTSNQVTANAAPDDSIDRAAANGPDGSIDEASPDAALSSEVLAEVERGDIDHRQLGERMGAVLQHANNWARRMVAEAEAEALKTRERAKTAARRITADAEAEAERLRADAEADADRRIKYAEARLEELRESAGVARHRAQTLKRRLAAVVERLEEEDYNLELPAGVELPELTEEIEESAEAELQLDREQVEEVRLDGDQDEEVRPEGTEQDQIEEAEVVDSHEIKTGGREA